MGERGTQCYKSQTLLITKRNDKTHVFGVNWLKHQPITINKISLDKNIDQSKTIHRKYRRIIETAQ